MPFIETTGKSAPSLQEATKRVEELLKLTCPVGASILISTQWKLNEYRPKEFPHPQLKLMSH